MEKIIHIHAKNNHFEIFEQLSESKAVERLQQIKEAQAKLLVVVDRYYDAKAIRIASDPYRTLKLQKYGKFVNSC